MEDRGPQNNHKKLRPVQSHPVEGFPQAPGHDGPRGHDPRCVDHVLDL